MAFDLGIEHGTLDACVTLKGLLAFAKLHNLTPGQAVERMIVDEHTVWLEDPEGLGPPCPELSELAEAVIKGSPCGVRRRP